jgi:hypothetical protein
LLQELDVLFTFRDPDSDYGYELWEKITPLLIKDCPCLKILKINHQKAGLLLKVEDCPNLKHLFIEAKDPHQISIDDLKELETFQLELLDDLCFLELDRFDVKVFHFAN